ncbi:hypothetical protein D9756_006379 [Leucocoprinus leucothites]|uniref:Uncharacterized protein n=1 Tax=Leucocoprinus leucothites TaxID=201217 RepID=A0A8H5G278_9AGAR|nr:hypothetical protein D9756_006379 [Leucoagaricus leucothites]
MSMTICWWFIALLALLRGISAQTAGTIHLFASNGCTGSHMSCGNIPANGCCTTGGDVFASAFLVSFQQQAFVDIHAQTECQGVSRQANSLACFQPSFAFSAAHWSTSSSAAARRDAAETNSTEFKDCRRPDSITLIDDDGTEVKIAVPEGENTDYEHAFVKGDYTKLMKLAKINRNLRFSR